jgi:three-Cys-motif partner protein
MAGTFAEFDEIGYWSEIKLEIVRDYASAYSRILNSKNLPHVYVDAFAGPGQHISKNTGEFVPGSPLKCFKRPPSVQGVSLYRPQRRKSGILAKPSGQ